MVVPLLGHETGQEASLSEKSHRDAATSAPRQKRAGSVFFDIFGVARGKIEKFLKWSLVLALRDLTYKQFCSLLTIMKNI